MKAHLLISEIKNQGLNIQSVEGNLHIFPRQRITDSIRNTIKQHKADLVKFLEAYEERAAIMEFDGRIEKQKAETAAWVDLMKGLEND